MALTGYYSGGRTEFGLIRENRNMVDTATITALADGDGFAALLDARIRASKRSRVTSRIRRTFAAVALSSALLASALGIASAHPVAPKSGSSLVPVTYSANSGRDSYLLSVTVNGRTVIDTDTPMRGLWRDTIFTPRGATVSVEVAPETERYNSRCSIRAASRVALPTGETRGGATCVLRNVGTVRQTPR